MRRRSPKPALRRLALAARLAVVIAAGALVVSSCSSAAPVVVTVTQGASGTSVANPTVTVPTQSATASESTSAPNSTSSTATAPRVSATPAFGTKDVGPNQPITVTAFHATLSSVTMTGDDGSVVAGEIADGKSWAPTGEMKYGVTYKISGESVDSDGASHPFDGTISTVKPTATMRAFIQIPNGAKVGIAAPIVVTFAGKVTNRAEAERQLHVTINGGDKIEGSWGWMQDEVIQKGGPTQSRVHFRPAEYWPGNTEVHVEANLYGIDYGDGGWGRENIVRDFDIGDKMVVKADVDSHRLLVLVNDAVVKNYPVSYGKPASVDEGRTTVSGIHVVQEMKPGEFEMCNPKYGYCGVKEYWGVRINNNGEFIHVNKGTEAKGLLGKANISHGCVNIGMKDGEEFFHMVYYGVPVEVENTGVNMTYSDYIWDWSVPYATWKTFSAL
ncbi:MAG: Ig-like domain-containing protein [Nakamurella sp.]